MKNILCNRKVLWMFFMEPQIFIVWSPYFHYMEKNSQGIHLSISFMFHKRKNKGE